MSLESLCVKMIYLEIDAIESWKLFDELINYCSVLN